MGKQKQPASKTTMYDHIRELQKRIVVSIAALIAAGVVAFLFYAQILKFLSAPLAAPLYYNNPAGGFAYVMKVCVSCAIVVTIPVTFFNVIMFFRPAFEKVLPIRRVILVTAFSTVLALSGAAFAYYVILPDSLMFFKGFQVSGLTALISADSYLNYLTSMIATFAIIFQIPLIMGFIDTIKPLAPRKLIKMEKWVVIGSLVVALLAPFTYDFVGSIMLAVPIIALYNMSILLILFQHAKRTAKDKIRGRRNIASQEAVVSEDEGEAPTIQGSLPPSPYSPPINNYEITEETQVEARPVFAVTSEEIIESHKTIYMDVRPIRARQPAVTPAAWVKERQQKRASLNSRGGTFSDIRPIHRPAIS